MRELIKVLTFSFLTFLSLYCIPVAGAQPLRLRAVPIANFDVRAVNRDGVVTGYDDDGNLIVYHAKTATSTILLEEVRGDISILGLSDSGLVLYSAVDDNDVQSVYVLSISGKRGAKTIFQRDYNTNRENILRNRKAGILTILTQAEVDYVKYVSSRGGSKQIAALESSEQLFLTDDGIGYGSYYEYNDETDKYEYRLSRINVKSRKLKFVSSPVLSRPVRTIVVGSNAHRVYGEASALESDASDNRFIFSARTPKYKLGVITQLADNESLQAVWYGLASILTGSSSDRRSRLITLKNSSREILCSGYKDVKFRLIALASNNFALAEMQATDSQQRHRDEYMLLVPIKNKLGRKDISSWSCRVGK